MDEKEVERWDNGNKRRKMEGKKKRGEKRIGKWNGNETRTFLSPFAVAWSALISLGGSIVCELS